MEKAKKSSSSLLKTRDSTRNHIGVPRDFETIQEAVNNAEEHDVVHVEPGNYDEDLNVDVEGLTMEGPNSGTTGFGGAREEEAVIKGTVNIGASNDHITFSGFKLSDEIYLCGKGIRFSNNIVESRNSGVVTRSPSRPSSFVLEQNKINVEGAYGVLLWMNEALKSVEIVRNAIVDCNRGIQTVGVDHNGLELNISNNVLKKNEMGLVLVGAKGDFKIVHNQIMDSKKKGIDLYANIFSIEGLKVKYNKIETDGKNMVLIGDEERKEEVEISSNEVEGMSEMMAEI